MKYYHCSNRTWKVGDIITAQAWRGYENNGIYVSTKPEPHFTLHMNGLNSVQSGMRLYQVKPLHGVKNGKWGDLYCPVAVEVVASLGEVAKSGNMSIVYGKKNNAVIQYDRDSYCITRKKSNKPKWIVVKITNNPLTGENKKFVRGFKRKDAAEKYAAKNPLFHVIKREEFMW